MPNLDAIVYDCSPEFTSNADYNYVCTRNGNLLCMVTLVLPILSDSVRLMVLSIAECCLRESKDPVIYHGSAD